jgi:Flp pilus assembly protein TadG
MSITSGTRLPPSGRRKLGDFIRNNGGVAAIEFALIAPVMLIMFYGAWEYSRVITADRKVTKIAGSVADLVARTPDPSSPTGTNARAACADFNPIFQITDVLLAPFPPGQASVTVYNIRTRSDNKSDVEVKWSVWNGRGAKAASPTSYVQTNSLLVDKTGDEVIVAVVSYPYPVAVSGIGIGGMENASATQTFTLAETAPMKPRIGPITLTSTSGGGTTICSNGS